MSWCEGLSSASSRRLRVWRAGRGSTIAFLGVGSAETANHRGMLVKAVIASTVGTAIEWYDFFLYSAIPPLVFAKLFFPNSDPLVGTLQAFLIYFVGFL